MKNYKLHFYLYLILIILGSSIPGRSVPNLFLFSWDKLLHVVEYYIFGILGYRAFQFEYKNIRYFLPISGIIFGCIDEAWQSFIPGRYPSYYDIIADGIGVTFGVISFIFFKRYTK